MRIGFRGPHATAPVLARLARELGIEANILAGRVDEIARPPLRHAVIGVADDPRSALLGILDAMLRSRPRRCSAMSPEMHPPDRLRHRRNAH